MILFNKSFATGIYPDAFKFENIIPLHKAGSKVIMDNYRPISLLPVISKLLEKMMFNRLIAFMNHTGQYYVKQFGFRSEHSTNDAIALLVGEILNGFNNGFYTLALFIDLKKRLLILSTIKFY